jgi:hypothetical protein
VKPFSYKDFKLKNQKTPWIVKYNIYILYLIV